MQGVAISEMQYDMLGRRIATINSREVSNRQAAPVVQATRSSYVGAEQDPYAESTSDPKQPDTRWMLRVDGALQAELRDDNERYLIANQQGSTISVQNASPATDVVATFDYDSYGSTLAGTVSYSSGTEKERNHTVYTYTGMRTNKTGDTTNHHARDYNATLRQWIQTDQYLDPYSDMGLSMDPTTRARSPYGGSNPISNVDTNGHRVTTGDCNAGCKIWDPRQEPGAGDGTIHVGGSGSSSATDDRCYTCYLKRPVTVGQANAVVDASQRRVFDAEWAAQKAARRAEKWETVNDWLDASMVAEASTCAAGCEGLIAFPFSAAGRGATTILGRGAKTAATRSMAKAAAAGRSNTASAAMGALLREDLRLTEAYGQAGRRVLENGRIRYYGSLRPARTEGRTLGTRTVKEWDPMSGNYRTWMESLNQSSKVIQVRPGQPARLPHYMFDDLGGYVGSWG